LSQVFVNFARLAGGSLCMI